MEQVAIKTGAAQSLREKTIAKEPIDASVSHFTVVCVIRRELIAMFEELAERIEERISTEKTERPGDADHPVTRKKKTAHNRAVQDRPAKECIPRNASRELIGRRGKRLPLSRDLKSTDSKQSPNDETHVEYIKIGMLRIHGRAVMLVVAKMHQAVRFCGLAKKRADKPIRKQIVPAFIHSEVPMGRLVKKEIQVSKRKSEQESCDGNSRNLEPKPGPLKLSQNGHQNRKCQIAEQNVAPNDEISRAETALKLEVVHTTGGAKLALRYPVDLFIDWQVHDRQNRTATHSLFSNDLSIPKTGRLRNDKRN
jgi:hypothetical protein